MDMTIILGLGLIIIGAAAHETIQSKMKKAKVPVKKRPKK